jgi:phosphoglycolate phosphatase-like HAD superfamily hydrolase
MLIIFYIDGTLCDTHEVDAVCYAGAIEQVTGRSLSTVDWSSYPEATNAAITKDFLHECGEKEMALRERQIREEFVRRLEDKGRKNPGLFRPIDGALEIINDLRMKNYSIAIATGCWQESAHAKLRLAGFDVTGIPFASSSDTRRRADIIALAAARAGCAVSDSIYVGDGVWDVKAARELGMLFIGIGRKHELLREHGARRVLASFRDRKAFFDALHDV